MHGSIDVLGLVLEAMLFRARTENALKLNLIFGETDMAQNGKYFKYLQSCTRICTQHAKFYSWICVPI
jgi:hypothetical protein